MKTRKNAKAKTKAGRRPAKRRPRKPNQVTKPPKPPKTPPGEKARIDFVVVKRLARLGMDLEDIATELGVDERTLRRRRKSDPRIEQAIREGRTERNSWLYRSIEKSIEHGNTRMLQMASKNWLGWSDNPPPRPQEDDEDWVFQTRLSDGSFLLIADGTDPVLAYHAAMDEKRKRDDQVVAILGSIGDASVSSKEPQGSD